MGFDLARDCHHSLCTGRRAYRVGLAPPPFRKRSELVQPTRSKLNRLAAFRRRGLRALGQKPPHSPGGRDVTAVPRPRGCASTPTRSRPELASPLERGVDAGGATPARVFLDHMKLKLVAFDSPSISPDSLRKVEGAEGRVEEVDFVPSDHDLPTAARFPDARSAVGTFPNGQADGRQPTRLDTQPVPLQLRRCGITRRFLRVGGRCGRLACRACRAGLRSG